MKREVSAKTLIFVVTIADDCSDKENYSKYLYKKLCNFKWVEEVSLKKGLVSELDKIIKELTEDSKALVRGSFPTTHRSLVDLICKGIDDYYAIRKKDLLVLLGVEVHKQ